MGERGVECGVHYKPLFEMSYYRHLGHTAQYFPNAAYAGRRVVSLPMYPDLRLSDVDYVCDQIKDIITRFKR
jgi:dTDP-4-amino-4,6-dideoxygalactose transaminase